MENEATPTKTAPVAPESKPCPECKVVKKMAEFSRSKRQKWGRKRLCKVCDAESQRQYRAQRNGAMPLPDSVPPTDPITASAAPPVSAPETIADTAPKPVIINLIRGPLPEIANQPTFVELPSNRAHLSIDMTDYPDIYKSILDISRQEFRTPEMQVLFWLTQHLHAATAA